MFMRLDGAIEIDKKRKRWFEKLVFYPDSMLYGFWIFFRLFFVMVEFICYPYGAAIKFPDDDWFKNLLIGSQAVFVVDILLKFFKAIRIEADEREFITKLNLIFENYYQGELLSDVVLTIPWGFLGTMLHKSLRFLHMIKALRFFAFLQFFTPKFYMPHIRNVFNKRLQKVLKDHRVNNNKN